MTVFNICRLLKCEVQLKTFHNEKALVKHCQTSLSCLPGRRRRCGPWPRRTRCTCRGAGRRSRRSCEHCCEIVANIVLCSPGGGGWGGLSLWRACPGAWCWACGGSALARTAAGSGLELLTMNLRSCTITEKAGVDPTVNRHEIGMLTQLS